QSGMTHDLINRLLSMQKVFGKEAGESGQTDFAPLVELAGDISQRNGEGVPVDLQIKDVLARLPNTLREPVQMMMTQLVRNAVLHGIETPSERLAQRKHPVGEIQIRAHRLTENHGKIILTVRDDGRGLNYDLLRRRAV